MPDAEPKAVKRGGDRESRRRQFTVEYKRKIVKEADACKTPGRS
jgi:hypothetical protein